MAQSCLAIEKSAYLDKFQTDESKTTVLTVAIDHYALAYEGEASRRRERLPT